MFFQELSTNPTQKAQWKGGIKNGSIEIDERKIFVLQRSNMEAGYLMYVRFQQNRRSPLNARSEIPQLIRFVYFLALIPEIPYFCCCSTLFSNSETYEWSR